MLKNIRRLLALGRYPNFLNEKRWSSYGKSCTTGEMVASVVLSRRAEQAHGVFTVCFFVLGMHVFGLFGIPEVLSFWSCLISVFISAVPSFVLARKVKNLGIRVSEHSRRVLKKMNEEIEVLLDTLNEEDVGTLTHEQAAAKARELLLEGAIASSRARRGLIPFDVFDTHRDLESLYRLFVLFDLVEVPELQAIFATAESEVDQEVKALGTAAVSG